MIPEWVEEGGKAAMAAYAEREKTHRPQAIERMAKAIVAASWKPNPLPKEDIEAIWTAVPEAERANARRLAEAAYGAL